METTKTKEGFYAVRVGRQTGVFASWADCQAQTTGFAGAKYKKFANATDAEAFVAGTLTAAAEDVPQVDKGKKRAVEQPVEDEPGWSVVYSDGACKGNGKPGSVAGVGVWWGHNDPRNIAERCPGDQTNNRAELIAIVRVLETAPWSKKPLMIKTDSKYSIQCFERWLPKWRDNGFLLATGHPVKHQPLIRYLDALITERRKAGQKIHLKYVQGHAGIEGNEGADAQANLGAKEPAIPERDWAQLEAALVSKSADRMDTEEDEDGENEGFGSSNPTGNPTKVRRVEGSLDLPNSAISHSQSTSSVSVQPPPLAGGLVSPLAGASSPRTTKERYPGQERSTKQEASGDHGSLTKTPIKTHSEKPRRRISDVPDDPLQLLGSERAKSRALDLYPPLEGEGKSTTPAVERFPSHPKTPTKSDVNSTPQKKPLTQIDLDLVSEPLRSPSKATKHGKLAHLPSASERFAIRSISPRAQTPPPVPVVALPPSKLTKDDINFEDFMDCLADDAELARDLEDDF